MHRRSRLFPRDSDRSTSTTPIFSWTCSPAHAIAKGSPTACGSGRRGSKRPMPTRRLPWGFCTVHRAVANHLLVKAGLIPRLADDVLTVHVEATADQTEVRLLSGLRKTCRELPDGLDLKGTIVALRQGQGPPAVRKVLIVVDQFEQWLHANRSTIPSWCWRRTADAMGRKCSAWSSFATISGWRRPASCGKWRIGSSKVSTRTRWTCFRCATPTRC